MFKNCLTAIALCLGLSSQAFAGAQVFDNTGANIGPAVSTDHVVLFNGTVPVDVSITPSGLVSASNGPFIYYAGAGCSGQAYMIVGGFVSFGTLVSGTIYYADVSTAGNQLVASFKNGPSGTCTTASQTLYLGDEATMTAPSVTGPLTLVPTP